MTLKYLGNFASDMHQALLAHKESPLLSESMNQESESVLAAMAKRCLDWLCPTTLT